MEDAGREDGARWRPAVPTLLVAVAMIIALVAVSALIVVLFRQTTGPGQVLREFAGHLAEENCPGAYALLDDSVQRALSEEEWCENLPDLAAQLSPDFQIVRIVLQGDGAMVEVASESTSDGSWFLDRDGRSWRIRGAGPRIEFPGR